MGGQRGEGGEEGLEEEELVRWESMSSLNTTAAQTSCLFSQTHRCVQPVKILTLNVAVSKPKTKTAVGASSGLRALIAAKRKASEAVTEDSEEDASAAKEKKNKMEQSGAVIPKIVAEDKEEEVEKTFEGGFFSVKSPVQKPKSPRMSAANSPRSPLATKSPHSASRSPASAGITKSTGGDR